VTSATTGALANGIVRFNFSGAHTANGLQIDDATLTGTAVALGTTALTSGNALSITGGGANMLTGGNVASLAMGAATVGSGIKVANTGAYTDTAAAVVNIVASTASTTGNILAVTTISDKALMVGRVITTPAFQVDASTATSVTGIKIKSAAAAAGVAVSAISSGTDENLTVDAKGAGTVTVGGTSTGRVTTGSANAVNVRPGNAVRATADLTATTNVTLANITGLSMNLEAGRKYVIRAKLFTTSTANGGLKVGFGGTATATSMIAEAKSYTTTTLNGSAQVTALGAILGATVATDSAEIWAEIIVNAAGTLTIQAAQNASHAETTTVKIGSFMIIEDVI